MQDFRHCRVVAALVVASCGPKDRELFDEQTLDAPVSSRADAGMPGKPLGADVNVASTTPSEFCGGSGEPCCQPPVPPCAAGYQCAWPSSRCETQQSDPNLTRLCRVDSNCATNERCCVSGAIGSCVALGAGEACARPDLAVMIEGPSPLSRKFSAGDCDFSAIGTAGRRRLLRFSVTIFNVGTGPLVLGDPGSPGLSWGLCGEVLAEQLVRYELLNSDGVLVSSRYAPLRPGCGGYVSDASSRFSCELLGLEPNRYETQLSYSFSDLAPFLDVTGVQPGDYVIRVIVNPPAEGGERPVIEEDYSDNEFELPYTLQIDDPHAACSVRNTDPWEERDCGWRPALTSECELGTTVVLGCPDCMGDPVLRVCQDEGVCLGASAIKSGDDFAGLCPQVSFACPPLGRYAALEGPYSANDASASCVVREVQASDAGVEGNP